MPQDENLIKIYIVDDNENVAESLKATIDENFPKTRSNENLQIQVDIETDFDKAMDVLLNPHSYDIAILDVFRGSIEGGDKPGLVLWNQILSENLCLSLSSRQALITLTMIFRLIILFSNYLERLWKVMRK